MSISASNDTGPVICSAVCVSLEQDEMSVCLRSEIINLLLSYACDEIPLTRGRATILPLLLLLINFGGGVECRQHQRTSFLFYQTSV